MDKESIYLLQKFDCNCNNCKFMDRDLVEFNLWAGYFESLDYITFLRERRHELSSAANLIYGNGEQFEAPDCRLEKFHAFTKRKNFTPSKDSAKQGRFLEGQARKMRFQFDRKKLLINYGICLSRKGKWNQPVTFIPNTLQMDTRECFVHRND